jgi:hypothetical protein
VAAATASPRVRTSGVRRIAETWWSTVRRETKSRSAISAFRSPRRGATRRAPGSACPSGPKSHGNERQRAEASRMERRAPATNKPESAPVDRWLYTHVSVSRYSTGNRRSFFAGILCMRPGGFEPPTRGPICLRKRRLPRVFKPFRAMDPTTSNPTKSVACCRSGRRGASPRGRTTISARCAAPWPVTVRGGATLNARLGFGGCSRGAPGERRKRHGRRLARPRSGRSGSDLQGELRRG